MHLAMLCLLVWFGLLFKFGMIGWFGIAAVALLLAYEHSLVSPRDLRRLMKSRAEEGEAGERAIDAVVLRLKDLRYLSDTRFAADYTRMRKENQGFGRRRVQQDLTQKGIQFHLSAKVLRIEGHTLHFAAQDGTQSSIEAETILNSTGRRPNVEDIGLEKAGIDFTPRGVKTSDQGKTNVPGVWACGDVTGRRMLAHAATREGIVAVNNMFGLKDAVRYNALPAVVYTHPEMAMVGRTEEELKAAGIQYKKSLVPMAVAGRYLVEHEDGTGVVKVLCGAEFGEILGVSSNEILPVAVLGVVCIVAVGVLYRRLLLTSIAPEIAAARGLRPQRIETAFLVVVACATTMTVPVVGALLIFTLMIGPPAAARCFTNRTPDCVDGHCVFV